MLWGTLWGPPNAATYADAVSPSRGLKAWPLRREGMRGQRPGPGGGTRRRPPVRDQGASFCGLRCGSAHRGDRDGRLHPLTRGGEQFGRLLVVAIGGHFQGPDHGAVVAAIDLVGDRHGLVPCERRGTNDG